MRTLMNTLFLLLALSLLPACQSGPTTPQTEQPPAVAQLSPEQQHELNGQLILAAYAADLPEVERLLAAGADPNARAGERADDWFDDTDEGGGYAPIGSRQWTPLLACANNWQSQIDQTDLYPLAIKLIDAGADIDSADSHGATVLYAAIKHGETELALHLIRLGAEVNTDTEIYIDASEGSPLMLAVKKGDRAAVRALIRAGADVDYGIDFGWTPLRVAVNRGDEWMTLALIEAGADVNATSGSPEYGGVRSILCAAIKHRAEGRFSRGFEALEAAGATWGDPTRIDWSTVYQDARQSRWLTVRLIEHGVPTDQVDEYGESILHRLASDSSAYNGLHELLESSDVDLDLVNEDGDTPLSLALNDFSTLYGTLANAVLLLEYGANPNIPYADGGRLLHNEVWDANPAIVAMLLEYGADPTAVDEDGQTPLSIAMEYDDERHQRIASMLRAAIVAWEEEAE